MIKEEKRVQWLVYYINKRLLGTKTRYLELGKLALALVIVSRKLRPYFLAHIV